MDRYGEPPRGVMNLVAIALLRAQGAKAGIREIAQKDGKILFTFAQLDLQAVSAICADAQLKGRVLFSAGADPMLTLRMAKGDDPLKLCQSFLARLQQLTAPRAPATGL